MDKEVKKVLGNIDIYKFYANKCRSKEITPKSEHIFTHVLDEMNTRIVHLLLQESEEFIIPHNLGKLRVIKKLHQCNKQADHHTRIDWGQTNKLGYKVYYTDDIVYQVKWFKKVIYPGNYQDKYYFKPCFTLRETLANCIKVQKIDYFS